MEGHIYVYGEIVSYQGDDAAEFGVVSPKTVLNQIQSASSAESLTIHINSQGGDVDAGFAIYDILRSVGKPITTIIEGQCYSIATVIALAGDSRLATQNSGFLIHNPWTQPEPGDAKKMRQAADVLDKFQAKIAEFYSKITGLSVENILQEMEKDEFMDLTTAKEYGFITEIIETVKAVAKINTKTQIQMSEQTEVIHAPKGFMAELKALFSGKVKALVLKTAADLDVDFTEVMEGDVSIGDTATVDGAPAEGTHVMTDGRTFVFEAGVLTEIVEPTEEGEDMEALKAENEALKAKIDEFKASTETALAEVTEEVKALKASITDNAKTYSAIKALVSGVVVEDKKEQKNTQKTEGKSIFSELLNTKK